MRWWMTLSTAPELTWCLISDAAGATTTPIGLHPNMRERVRAGRENSDDAQRAVRGRALNRRVPTHGQRKWSRVGSRRRWVKQSRLIRELMWSPQHHRVHRAYHPAPDWQGRSG